MDLVFSINYHIVSTFFGSDLQLCYSFSQLGISASNVLPKLSFSGEDVFLQHVIFPPQDGRLCPDLMLLEISCSD